jgi:hypothetical protein
VAQLSTSTAPTRSHTRFPIVHRQERCVGTGTTESAYQEGVVGEVLVLLLQVGQGGQRKPIPESESSCTSAWNYCVFIVAAEGAARRGTMPSHIYQ